MNVVNFTDAAADCLRFVKDVIERHGPRLAGTEPCRNSAIEIHNRFSESCDEVFLEGFDFHRGAFTGFMKFLAIAYVLMTLFAFLGDYWLIPAMFIYVLCLVSALGEFVFYKEIFDPLYKKSKGWNVSGVILPRDEVRQQIIVVGHHDSAHEFSFLVHLQKWYSIRIMAGLLCVFVLGFFVLIRGIFFVTGGNHAAHAALVNVLLLLGLAAVLPFYFFISKKAVPGAGDNLIATAIVWRIAGIFGAAKKRGRALLGSTRLVFLSTDAEEEGLRGARAYVKKHKSELLGVPTYAVNIDSLYSLKDLRCLTSDMNGFMKTSRRLAEELGLTAGRLGYELPAVPLSFGGGATDAAEFAGRGISAISIIGLSTRYIRKGMVYHTMNDTVDKIEPGIVEAVLRIVYNFVLKKDEMGSGASTQSSLRK